MENTVTDPLIALAMQGVEWSQNALDNASFWSASTIQQARFQLEHHLAQFGWTEPEHLNIAVFAILFTTLFLTMGFWLILGQLGKRRVSGAPLRLLTKRPRRNGILAVILLVGVFGGWSVLAPLAGAAIAPGVVSPDGSRKTVEHLEGGIIRYIHVREGDQVIAGEVLFTLEDIQAKARYREVRERYLHLRATEARLNAERGGEGRIFFPLELNGAPNNEASQAMSGQRALFVSRRKTLERRIDILNQRTRQLQEQNIGLASVVAGKIRQSELILEEAGSVEILFNQGLVKYPRVLALRRAEAQIGTEIAINQARISENLQRMGETEIQLLTLQEQYLERANTELVDVQRQLAEIQGELPSRADILARTVVRAPIAGQVMNVRVTTETEVIHPGETLLEIVPQGKALIIDAKIRPTDIERVHPGMEARIILSAYRQRSLPLIHGILLSVSADRLVEDRTGEPYYLAKVEINLSDLNAAEDVELVPGMPAEVMLLDGEKTLMNYLLDPLLRSFDRSFREG